MKPLRLPAALHDNLRCPHCGANLPVTSAEAITCVSCGSIYPVVDGALVLLDPANPLFDAASVETNYYGAARANKPSGGLRGLLRAAANRAPSLGVNLKAADNAQTFLELVRARAERPAVLIVGGGSIGEGSEAIVEATDIDLVITDVYLSAHTHAVADGHQLPFEDATFDGISAQAVLEHVLDPFQVVA
ncbi:MAG: methyltransferase domain-containing protein, partial [Chloroflexota bacterium]